MSIIIQDKIDKAYQEHGKDAGLWFLLQQNMDIEKLLNIDDFRFFIELKKM